MFGWTERTPCGRWALLCSCQNTRIPAHSGSSLMSLQGAVLLDWWTLLLLPLGLVAEGCLSASSVLQDTQLCSQWEGTSCCVVHIFSLSSPVLSHLLWYPRVTGWDGKMLELESRGLDSISCVMKDWHIIQHLLSQCLPWAAVKWLQTPYSDHLGYSVLRSLHLESDGSNS